MNFDFEQYADNGTYPHPWEISESQRDSQVKAL